jgi:hypothetical protein
MRKGMSLSMNVDAVVGEEEQRDGYMLRAFCNAIHQSVFEASAYFGSALRVPATLN